MKPKIGIPVPTTIDPAYNQRSWPAYATAVASAGGDPIEIPLTLPAADLEALAATCHGFLLPGSPADVDPTLYDTPRLPACGPQDAPREQTDFALLTHAAATGKPLLGICYGCQSLNVFHGGSLIQDLSPLPVNHAAGASVAIAHSVLIPTDTTLATLLTASDLKGTGFSPSMATSEDLGALAPEGTLLAAPPVKVSPSRVGAAESPTLRLPVNTSHHQSVALPGANLRISARCPDDDVIEAIELIPIEPEESVEPKMFHVEHPAAKKTQSEQSPQRSRREDPSAKPPFPLLPLRFPSSPRLLLGVQWHPERSLDISPASRALFQALITAAQPFAPTPCA